MMNAGYLVGECKAALRLYGADDETSIWQSLNLSLQHLSGLRSWVALRRKITISFSGHDANNSMLLPADMAGIDDVIDTTLGHQYIATDRSRAEHSDAYGDDRNYRWFYTDAETDATAILTNVAMDQGASTFACTGWNNAHIGDYVQFGNELGFYKLTAANTFTPRWLGPKMQGSPTDVAQVRPAGTKRFSIVDYDGVFLAATSVDVYYWVYATPLYQPYQPILLPDFKPLELLTIINVLGLKDRKEAVADNYRALYDKALAKMEDMNPDFMPPNVPVDRLGNRLSFTGKY